jgi:hypothetical protein
MAAFDANAAMLPSALIGTLAEVSTLTAANGEAPGVHATVAPKHVSKI